MRTPLYRAKAINREPNRVYRTDYKNGDWVYGLISRLDEYFAEMTNENGVSGIDIDRNTICEYAQLLDKNKNRIFDSDICTDGEIVYAVIFKKQQFAVRVIKSNYTLIRKGDTFPLWHFDNCKKNGYKQLEVIGNIYDNPDLLKD